MKEYLVVIPYLAKEAQGRELDLAVKGWRNHFQEPHTIVVVGDAPTFHMPTYTPYFIECPRVRQVKGQYLPHLDHVHKFRRVREEFPDAKEVIYACDDMYAVKDFTIKDVLLPKAPEQGQTIPPFNARYESGWWRDLGKTRDLCFKEHLPRLNWVCHLPVLYEWDKLIDIYDRYNCDNESYIVENIYFNKYTPEDKIAWPANCFRDEVKTSSPDIRPLGTVTWITNTNSGWSERLESILTKHYDSLI